MVSFDSAHLSCGDKASLFDVIGECPKQTFIEKEKKSLHILTHIFDPAHINHIRNTAGVNHVGLGAGYDGILR